MIITDEDAKYVFKTSGIPPDIEAAIGQYMAKKHTKKKIDCTGRGPNKHLTEAQQDVVDAVAKGYTTSPEIAKATNRRVSRVATILGNLEHLGYAARVVKRGRVWLWSINFDALPSLEKSKAPPD